MFCPFFPTDAGGFRRAIGAALAVVLMMLSPGAGAASVEGPVPEPPGEPDADTVLLRVEGVARPTALTRAEIERLPLYATELRTGWGMEGRFMGVRLLDLMEAHGLADADNVRLTALDDYAVSLSRAQLEETTALLVTRIDGEPLTLEQSGPLILMWPELAEAVLDGSSPMATWIWSVSTLSPEDTP